MKTNTYFTGEINQISACEAELIHSLENDFKFPEGSLTQGFLGFQLSDIDKAVWTRYGGMAICQNKTLYTLISDTISSFNAQEYSELESILNDRVPPNCLTAPFSLDILLYHPGKDYLVECDSKWKVEQIDPLEFYPDNDEPGTGPRIQYIYGVRENSSVIARASSNWPIQMGSYYMHAVGVGTHPDHRN